MSLQSRIMTEELSTYLATVKSKESNAKKAYFKVNQNSEHTKEKISKSRYLLIDEKEQARQSRSTSGLLLQLSMDLKAFKKKPHKQSSAQCAGLKKSKLLIWSFAAIIACGLLSSKSLDLSSHPDPAILSAYKTSSADAQTEAVREHGGIKESETELKELQVDEISEAEIQALARF